MKWLKRFFEDQFTKQQRKEFFDSNIKIDVRKSKIILILLLILESALLLLTYLRDVSNQYGSYMSIYRALYYTMIVVSIFLLTLINIYDRKQGERKFKGLMFIGTIFVLFVLLWSVVINVVDISRGINSAVYLYAALTISIFVFINPVKSFIIYLISFALYSTMIHFLVDDNSAIFSSLINGSSYVITAWIISIAQYYSRKKQFISDKLILKKNEQLIKMADIDPLTNTFNRRSLDRLLKELYNEAKDEQKHISV